MKSGLPAPGSGMTGGFGAAAAAPLATRSADDDAARERLVEPGSSGWSGGKLGSIGVRAAAGRTSVVSNWLSRAVVSAAIASVDATSVSGCSSYFAKVASGADPDVGAGDSGADAVFGRSP